MIKRIHIAAATSAVLVAIACARPAISSPDPSATPAASPADPCGDTNLLATTDRPTFGTNPCVVKLGTAIVELGYRNTTTFGNTSASHLAVVPQDRNRIGVVKGLEVIIDAPSAVHFAEGGRVISGTGNLGTGLKYEFGYFGGFVDGIAAEVVYPTGSAAFNNNGLPDFNASYQIGGPITRNLGFNLTLGFNSFSSPASAVVAGKTALNTAVIPQAALGGILLPELASSSLFSATPAVQSNVSTTAFTPSLILGGAVAPQTKLNVEFANISSSGPGSSGQYYGNVFLQHQFGNSFLLDVEAAERLTVVNGTHQFYVGAGGSIRL